MPISRISLAQPIESRAASFAKDSYSKNCYFETKPTGEKEVVKRPGITLFSTSPALPSTYSQGLYTFAGNLYAASNNILYKITPGGVSSVIGTMTGQKFPCTFNQTATIPYMTVQNLTHVYTVKTDGTFAVASQLDVILTAIGADVNALAYGLVYLDGYTFVMVNNGRIYNSAIEDPTTWNAMDYITAEAEPDAGVAIVKHFNYLIAFGEWSTEFFYDARNAVGSPLARNDSARLEIGCANGGSIAQIEQALLWVGKSKKHGKSVYIMDGLSPTRVSTSYIERHLNADTLDDTKAYAFKIEGHTFYVLTLYAATPNARTFVYDVDEKMWYNWTNYDTGVEYYFKLIYYSEFNLGYYGINADTSAIYNISVDAYSDDTNPIYFGSTTSILDSGTTKRKFYRSMEIVGDKIAGTMQISHSDNDYQTWSTPRSVDLSKGRPQIYQLGAARRRAWRFSCTDNVPLRISAAELNFDIGDLEGGSS